LAARFRFRKRVRGRGTRRLPSRRIRCLEKLQRLPNNAPRPSLRGRFRTNILDLRSFDSGNEEWTLIRVSPMAAMIGKRVGAEIVMLLKRGRYAVLARLTFLPVLFDFGE